MEICQAGAGLIMGKEWSPRRRNQNTWYNWRFSRLCKRPQLDTSLELSGPSWPFWSTYKAETCSCILHTPSAIIW